MVDIMQLSNELFGSMCLISCEEVLYYFQVGYQITASALPSAEKLDYLCGKCAGQDEIGIQFRSVENFTFSYGQGNAYKDYISQLEQEDIVIITIKIQKRLVDEIFNVYNIEKFSEFLCGQKIEESFQLFSKLFDGGKQHIIFQVLNCSSCIHTSSIAFSSDPLSWDRETIRNNQIRNCNDTSVFLGRAQYPLVPQDFAVMEQTYDKCFGGIKRMFDRLRIVLSYLYLANTSNIVGNRAILQFDPAVNGYEYTLEQLSGNDYVWKIYHWIHKEDGCVGRAGIARNIINVHCRTADDILNIDEDIYNSVVANYVIYERKYTEQYIELKNKLSECIVESAGQLQELAHDLVEGFRNNFIAVIVFLMTVLLTDSIDFNSFTEADVSLNIVAVCGIFTFVSLLYMIVTIMAGKMKWGWVKRAYEDLKENYSDVLEKQDLAVAVKNDSAFINTEKEYKKFRFRICGVWSIAIIGMLVFTIFIGFRGQSREQTEISLPEDYEEEQAENEIPEAEVDTNAEKGYAE